jgi:hypothetical protein
MQKIIALYKLKPGVKIEEYKKWLHDVELKVTPNQKGIHNFEVFEVKGSADGPVTYQIIEEIVADSWEKWNEVSKSPAMKHVVESWGNYGDSSTVLMLYGDNISET